MGLSGSAMPDVAYAGPLGQESFWRPAELLVAQDDADHEAIRSELAGLDYEVAAGVRRYRLHGSDVARLVGQLRDHHGPTPRVSLNHLFAAQHRPPWYPHSHETFHFANFEMPRPANPPPGFLPPHWQPGPVRVGVLDTAVDHPLLQERTRVLAGDGEATRTDPGAAGVRLGDAAGHGTFVSGLIAHHAPRAELIVAPVMEESGVVEEFRIIQALDRSEMRACHVLNMSFAGYTEDDQPPWALSMVLNQYLDQDAAVLAAAGNGGGSQLRWPAALPGVIAVGATDSSGAPWSYSDHGPWVDVSARGVDVISTYLTAGPFNGWAQWSGTSAAVAQVTGVIVSLMAERAINARAAAEHYLKRTTEETTSPPVSQPKAGAARPQGGRYALLMYGDEQALARMSEADAAAQYHAYYAFTKDIIDRGLMQGGEALQPTNTATTVRVRNGETLTTDGPFAETKEQLGGFYIVHCKDLDEAIEIAAKIPGAHDGSIEVRPIMEFPAS